MPTDPRLTALLQINPEPFVKAMKAVSKAVRSFQRIGFQRAVSRAEMTGHPYPLPTACLPVSKRRLSSKPKGKRRG